MSIYGFPSYLMRIEEESFLNERSVVLLVNVFVVFMCVDFVCNLIVSVSGSRCIRWLIIFLLFKKSDCGLMYQMMVIV